MACLSVSVYAARRDAVVFLSSGGGEFQTAMFDGDRKTRPRIIAEHSSLSTRASIPSSALMAAAFGTHQFESHASPTSSSDGAPPARSPRSDSAPLPSVALSDSAPLPCAAPSAAAPLAGGRTQRALAEVAASAAALPRGARLLLHSCCAPCSGAQIKVLVDLGFDVTVLWYNPNIHPRAEYELRKRENLRYAERLRIPFVDLDYDASEWHARARGLEHAPERGARCTMCFDMRMERTALYAVEHGFTHFTTTNATSRWKDVGQVNAAGRRAAERHADRGLAFWEFDWQTDEMTRLKYEISAEERCMT